MHCASTYEHSLFEERRCDDKRIGADMLYLPCEDTSGAGSRGIASFCSAALTSSPCTLEISREIPS